jgi:DNA-binding response OmpR family regulator
MIGSRRTLIYVDDVSFGSMTVKSKLKYRYDVIPAQSLDILFKTLESTTPDMILVDVKKPEADGNEVMSRLNKDERYAGVPVIFITSQKDEETVKMCISLGAAAHVSKPFSSDILVEAIEGVLKKDTKSKEKPCILAVDDVASTLKAINFALQEKYKVYTLSNPVEVEGFLQNVKPDLFLLDFRMPVLNGFELIPIIRAFPEHKETPIIFITGEAKMDYMSDALNLGACAFIEKPFNPNSLREVIEKQLSKETNGGEI